MPGGEAWRKGNVISSNTTCARGEHASRRGLVAAVAAMIRRVVEEDAGHRAWTELVRRCGGQVGVA
jgi:hypothetical protein